MIRLVAMGAPALDLDLTSIIQLGMFFLLGIFLTIFVYGPYLRARDGREALTEGNESAAQRYGERANELTRELDEMKHERLADAERARKERMREASDEAGRIIEEARADAQRTIKAERNRMDAELSEASRVAKRGIAQISGDITRKILG